MLHNQFSIEISQEIDKEWWNSLVKSVPEGTIFQTTYWADYLKEWANVEPIYFIAKNKNNKTVGILLCFKEAHFIYSLARKPVPLITTFLAKKIMPLCSWREGPLIFEKENWKEILDMILMQLKNITTKGNTILGNLPACFNLQPQEEEMKNQMIDNKFQIKPWATFLVDLTQEENILWNNLNRAARRMVEKCQREGLTVERITDLKELDKYYKLLLETRKRLGFSLPSCFPNAVMWKYLKERGILEIFVAKQNNRWLAALGVIGFNNIFNEIAVAQSNYSLKNKIYSNDLIKWEIIKWGHRQGYKIYDLAGVSPDPKTAKEKGIYEFKAKWGGELVNYSTLIKHPPIFKKILIKAVSLIDRLF